MRYVISYDLNAPGKNYEPLYSALKAYGAKRILLSEWVVRWNGTKASTIRDIIAGHMGANDRLMVVCLDSTDWAEARTPSLIRTPSNAPARVVNAVRSASVSG